MAKVKHFKKRTIKFITKSGNIVEEQEQMTSEISKELLDRYTSSTTTQQIPTEHWENIKKEISDTDNSFLTSEVSNCEIRETVFDMAKDKSPGPDGFPVEFFQIYWPIVGGSVCLAVRSFFTQVT